MTCSLRDSIPTYILDKVWQIGAYMLGELEQLVLLGVMRAGPDAYGVPVHDEIQRRASRDLTLGTIYKTLARLEEKGLVESRMGEPTAQRGGRRTRCYRVTTVGSRALQSSIKSLRRMASGLDVGLDPA
jgi:PadR family transcriptional regulator PadR